MKFPSRLAVIGLLVLGVPVLASTSRAQQRPPIAGQVAKAYGLDSFGQIEEIRYTFNAEIGSATRSQSWVWAPKSGRVTYEGKDNTGRLVKVTYLRSQLASQSALVKNVIDPAFINDEYWLLFPLHVVWDSDAEVQDTGMHKLPLGKGSAERVVVKYPSAGGYTPGDTWELYIGAGDRVEAFVYRRGGSKKPQVVAATWSDYKKAGPLLISLDHRGTAAGKPLRVFFSNVAVKLAGSSSWQNAQ
jgi:hypothetical protein